MNGHGEETPSGRKGRGTTIGTVVRTATALAIWLAVTLLAGQIEAGTRQFMVSLQLRVPAQVTVNMLDASAPLTDETGETRLAEIAFSRKAAAPRMSVTWDEGHAKMSGTTTTVSPEEQRRAITEGAVLAAIRRELMTQPDSIGRATDTTLARVSEKQVYMQIIFE